MQYDFQDFLCPDSLFFGDTSTTNTSLMPFLSHVLCLSFFFFKLKSVSSLTFKSLISSLHPSSLPTSCMAKWMLHFGLSLFFIPLHKLCPFQPLQFSLFYSYHPDPCNLVYHQVYTSFKVLTKLCRCVWLDGEGSKGDLL